MEKREKGGGACLHVEFVGVALDAIHIARESNFIGCQCVHVCADNIHYSHTMEVTMHTCMLYTIHVPCA